MGELKTYGDLKKVIKSIFTQQKGEKIGQIALGTIINLIPGADAAKNTYDFIKAAFSKPDTKKTGTWLDKLDIDDDMSKIIDDTVENGFLKIITKTIENEPDDKDLENDFNMNAKMVDYLKNNYNNRTITGINEFKMKERFQQLAGLINELEVKQDPSVTTISKDLNDQGSSFTNINTKEKFEQLLDAITSKLTPEFKEQPGFKQAILSFYNKNK